MIYNETTMELEEKTEELLNCLFDSEESTAYKKALRTFSTSEEVAAKKANFLKAKKAYDAISEYGNYAPGYRETYRELRKAKREFDLLDEVGEFKAAQTSLQEQLDSVAMAISKAVSQDILVEYGNPFFHREGKKHTCKGGCHDGN